MDDHPRAVVGIARRVMRAPLLYVGGKIATSRLSLEPLTPAHADLMYDGFADPSLYAWVNADPPGDVDELRSRFARIAEPYAPDGALWLNWALRVTDGGAYAGVIEATVRPDRIVFLAYYVFTAHARRGLAREACAAVIEHLWRAYDATEIRADTDFRNVPSRCLVESLGFVRRTRHIVTTLRGAPSFDYRYRLKRPD
jgi:ribosomal-protein-alanine N-acetyltransferase